MAAINSIAFPFQQGSQSFPNPATDDDAIRASIIQIVTTARGERVMRPDFGCNAFSYVFENNTDEFQRLVERDIRYSLTKWEPRIAVMQVTVQTDDDLAPGQATITIFYTVIASGTNASVTVQGP